MNEIVFLSNKGTPVTDSLKVAEVFGKEHDKVIRDIENQISKLNEAGEEKFSNANFGGSKYISERGRSYKKYLLTEDAFTLIAMSYTTVEAMKFKVTYMNEFKRMKEHIKNQQTPKELTFEEKALAFMGEAMEKIKAQELQLEEQKPKVKFAESVEDSDNLILIRDLAKILNQNGYNTGGNRLFNELRERGYLCKGTNKPTQRSIELKVLRVVQPKPKNGVIFEPTTKVTGKGQVYFTNLFLKEVLNNG